MNRRGIILPLVLLGILATVAVIPFMVTNTETISKNIKAIDESNRIYWAAEGAACDAYIKSLKSNPTLEMDDLTIDKEGENIIATDAPRFQYGSFIASTTVVARTTLHEERACWVASASAEGYNFGDQIKAVYVKPGVTFNNDDGYAWDKNGILYRVKDYKSLAKVTQIKEPIWQMERNIILTVDGKVRYYSDGSEYSQFSNNSVVIDSISNNKYYRISKNNNVLNKDGNKIQWKNLLNDDSGELDDIVQIDGRYDHIFALKSNGDLYGWGTNKDNDYPIIRKLCSDKKIKTSFSENEAVLIKTQNVISNSVVDLTYYINKGEANPVGKYFSDTDKFGTTPHYCYYHKDSGYNSSCFLNYLNHGCKQMNQHPWTDNSFIYNDDNINWNCRCILCNEIRDINNLEGRSYHTDDKCHCDKCISNCIYGSSLLCNCEVCETKREHFWGCHCNEELCKKYRYRFFNDYYNHTPDKVASPSTPLHLEEDLKILDLQLLVDANSSFFYKNNKNFYNKDNSDYRSFVEFRTKFVPKYPKIHLSEIGTYTYGVTSNTEDKIYIVEGGKVATNTIKISSNTINNLSNVWIVTFATETMKIGGELKTELPKGDYEVIFEARLKIEEKSGNNWVISNKTTEWKTFEPYNMLWGIIDKEKYKETDLKLPNSKYLGCIFRLNEYLFNTTSGKLWEPHKVCAVSAGQYFSVILAKNTEKAVINRNKYKIMTWGSRDNLRLGREGIFGKKLADRGEMAEVVFKDDNDNVIDVAQYVRSIKTGKRHTIILTDYIKDGERIQEIWTWGQNKQFPVKISLPEELKKDPIVSIACGDTRNLLITENCNVYQWTNEDYAITISGTNPLPKQ